MRLKLFLIKRKKKMKQSEKQSKLESIIFDMKKKTYCNVKKLN